MARVVVVPDRDQVIPSFSGKVVKTLLISSNKSLEYIFNSKELNPKPIHISPLGYVSENGKIVYLWKKAGDPSKLRIISGRKYFFYIGFEESIEHQVLDAVNSIDGVKVFNTRWSLEEIDYTSIEIPSEKPQYRIKGDYIKVELRSPTNIIDPYKKSKYRRFLPLSGFLFAYNIGEVARILHRNDIYWELIRIFNTVLQETHHVWDTVKKIMYLYEGKAIPGLIGYIKYYIDKEYLEKNINIKLLIENTLTHATIMGVGSGRANGFGHITLKN